MSAEVFGLIGVILGFTLAEGSAALRHLGKIRNLKSVVRNELKSIRMLLPQKKAMLHEAISHLSDGKVMSTQSIHAPTSGYRIAIESLYGHLTHKERNCLHVIYESLRVGDEITDKFEGEFKADLRENLIPNAAEHHRGRLIDIIKMYETIEQLIDSYLSKNPIDVFPEDSEDN